MIKLSTHKDILETLTAFLKVFSWRKKAFKKVPALLFRHIYQNIWANSGQAGLSSSQSQPGDKMQEEPCLDGL